MDFWGLNGLLIDFVEPMSAGLLEVSLVKSPVNKDFEPQECGWCSGT